MRSLINEAADKYVCLSLHTSTSTSSGTVELSDRNVATSFMELVKCFHVEVRSWEMTIEISLYPSAALFYM